ncbi:MAG: hypothetical protein AB7L41_11225 [Flavobacteriaceae bacterium]
MTKRPHTGAVSAEMAAAIHGNTELVTGEFSGLAGRDVAADRDGVAYLEQFIERNRDNWDGDARHSLANVLGSFLGAALAAAGGKWVETEHGPGVSFGPDFVAFPFAKTGKFIEGGEGESLLSFYDTAVVMAAATR